jgi:hypothetical protein
VKIDKKFKRYPSFFCCGTIITTPPQLVQSKEYCPLSP